MTKISEKVLDTIKEQNICPKPKWHFLLKNYIIFLGFVISVVLGSLAFSVIIEMMTHSDLDIYKYLGKSLIGFFILSLPYVWMLFLVAFSFISYYNWKHTKQGYKYNVYTVVLSSVGLSVAAGTIFFSLGWGRKVDNVMAKTIPLYKTSKKTSLDGIWMHPDKGLLSGEVQESKEESVLVKDCTGRIWEVKRQSGCSGCGQIEKGKTIKIIGEKEEDQKFVANEIRGDGDDDDK